MTKKKAPAKPTVRSIIKSVENARVVMHILSFDPDVQCMPSNVQEAIENLENQLASIHGQLEQYEANQ